jgi:hypothetical protein
VQADQDPNNDEGKKMKELQTTEKPFDILTHNGTITVRNRSTDEHRTFQVKTQKDDAKFMPGKRLVSILSGSDNTRDYTSFGLINSGGSITLWRKLQGSPAYRAYSHMLQHPEVYEDCCTEKAPLGYEFLFSGTCRKCNRKLTCPESIHSGIGPVCAANITGGM